MIIDSVLVDEIPNNCFVCKFSDRNIWGNKWICILTEEFISDAVDMGVKDHNCPISVYKKSIYYHDHLLAMDKLKARITELESKQRWIPVSERLPEEDDGYCLICVGVDFDYITMAYYDKKYGWNGQFEGLGTITHWMPLPEPPEVQS